MPANGRAPYVLDVQHALRSTSCTPHRHVRDAAGNGPRQERAALSAGDTLVARRHRTRRSASAANTPHASTIMVVELFGAGAVVPLAVGCVVSYVFFNHGGIFTTLRIIAAKPPTVTSGVPSLQQHRDNRTNGRGQ